MKKRLSSNVIWLYSATVVNLLSGFVLFPFYIKYLGLEGFGTLMTIGIFSLTGYLSLLEFGFQTAVTRYVAEFVAKSQGIPREIWRKIGVNKIAGNLRLMRRHGTALSMLQGGTLIRGTLPDSLMGEYGRYREGGLVEKKSRQPAIAAWD